MPNMKKANFKAKKARSRTAVDRAKAELIKGIKKYDAAHPAENETASKQEEVEGAAE